MGIGSNPLVFEEATEGTAGAALPAGGEGPSSGGLSIQVFRVFVENKLAVVGALIILLMVLFCFLGPVFYHTNQTNAQLALLNSSENAAPGNGHLLGTDANGFDLLGRIMFGGQTSLEVGFAAAGIATLVGVL